MKVTRMNVCTLVLAVALATLITPAYNDLVAQIQETVPSVFRWFAIVFLYVVQGASALYGARFLSRWIFAHATGERSTSHRV